MSYIDENDELPAALYFKHDSKPVPALYFEHDGKPVTAELPQDASESALDDLLLEHGVIANAELIAALDAYTEQQATGRAAAMIREMLSRLNGCAAAVALRWVVLGVGEQPMREQAASIGVTHQAILKAAKLIRRKLGLPKDPSIE